MIQAPGEAHKWKADLKTHDHRICANCIHVRELTEEEEARYKNYPYGDAPNLYCEHPKDRRGNHPHPVWQGNHCFAHEWDDESVLLPGGHMWDYEQARANDLLIEKNQVRMEELLKG